MAENSKIEWTSATWNPITGCSVFSPGCVNCYAMTLAGTRLRNHPSRKGLTQESKTGPVWTGEVRLNEEWLPQPFHWKTPKDIFVVAHGDLFKDRVPEEWIEMVFTTIRSAPWHRYQILTKRVSRMRSFLERATPMRNVWIGVSVERQTEALERRGDLAVLAAQGWNTWASYEPALAAIEWRGWGFIKWLVSGGESGRDARPTHPEWHRQARNFCLSNGIPYFFKQWGEWVPVAEWSPGPVKQVAIDVEGKWVPDEINPDDVYGQRFVKVGKGHAGAMLDGMEWRQSPAITHA